MASYFITSRSKLCVATLATMNLGCTAKVDVQPAREPVTTLIPKTEELSMPELKWLDRFNGETVDELIAFEGKYRTDSIVLAFEQAIEQKSARIGVNRLTDEERVILAIEAFEREINNGGYDQFFVNSSGEYAPIIVDALSRIDCPITAEITRKASQIVENATFEENEDLQNSLGECDALFFKGQENIEESLFAYIKANRDKIATLPADDVRGPTGKNNGVRTH